MTNHLGPGATFADQSVSIARLHDLVDEATLHDLTAAACFTGIRLFSSTLPTTLTIGQPYIETDGRFWFHNGTTFQKDDMEPRILMSMLNSSGANLTAGDCVKLNIDAPGGIKLTGGIHLCFGVVQANVAAGATAILCVSGNTTARVSAITSTKDDGAWLLGPTSGSPVGRTIDPENPTQVMNVFGICLEESTVAISLRQVRIFK